MYINESKIERDVLTQRFLRTLLLKQIQIAYTTWKILYWKATTVWK